MIFHGIVDRFIQNVLNLLARDLTIELSIFLNFFEKQNMTLELYYIYLNERLSLATIRNIMIIRATNNFIEKPKPGTEPKPKPGGNYSMVPKICS